MSGILAGRQADHIIPPRAGEVSVLNVTNVAANIDLSLSGPSSDGHDNYPPDQKGCIGHFVALQADGGDVFFLTGPTSASVSGGNAPLATAAGNTTAGQNITQGCGKIPAGFIMPVRITPGKDNFLAYVTSAGTATLRLWRNSQ